MSETFSADWLYEREGFDARARSTKLADAFAVSLPARPRLIDLGCGTGSLFRWLAPRIFRAQAWIFADADAALLDEAMDETAWWAEGQGFTVTSPGRALLIHTPGGAWRIETRRLSLGDPRAAMALGPFDGVACSALLDLVSQSWIDGLAALLRVPLLACLSVDGRDTILPRHRHDGLVMSWFRRDQRRDKGFGPALGPDAATALTEALSARGFDVRGETSDWRIPASATVMLDRLVAGHADAALRWPAANRVAIDLWEHDRRDGILAGRLTMRIGHRDVLAIPPKT